MGFSTSYIFIYFYLNSNIKAKINATVSHHNGDEKYRTTNCSVVWLQIRGLEFPIFFAFKS